MKILKIAVLFLLFFGISSISSNTYSKDSISNTYEIPVTTYDVRINIDGRWYIITYNNDGYIVNIVEDDE